LWRRCGPPGSRRRPCLNSRSTTPAFAYVEQVRALTLRRGDAVGLDNLAFHKQPEVRAAIEAVGAHLQFLPPYSPNLNPIERWRNPWVSNIGDDCRRSSTGCASQDVPASACNC
jgi:transposase